MARCAGRTAKSASDDHHCVASHSLTLSLLDRRAAPGARTGYRAGLIGGEPCACADPGDWIGLAGAGCSPDERGVIAFYGIRGLGSAYYVAYALQRVSFEAPDVVWSTVAFVMLVSIVLHGATVTPVMSYP